LPAQDLLGSVGLELNHADEGTKLESVKPTFKEPENHSILSSFSPAGSPGVAPTSSAPIPAPHSGQPVADTNSITPSSLTTVVAPVAQILPEHQQPIEMVNFPASQPLSHFANNNPNKQPQMVQLVQALRLPQNASLATNKVSPNKPLPNKPVAIAPQPVPPTVKLPTEPSANQVQREITPAPPAAASAPDDPKNRSESVLSLVVIVKPSKSIPGVMTNQTQGIFIYINVNQQILNGLIYFLDVFIKSRLLMDNRKFAEWLMRVGLLRSHQVGICRVHNAQSLNPLQLRMYEDISLFPYR